jgi:hypothetical protein
MSAAPTGLTKVRTRSHVQKIRNSLQTERHPQKKVRGGARSHRQNNSINLCFFGSFFCFRDPFPHMAPHITPVRVRLRLSLLPGNQPSLVVAVDLAIAAQRGQNVDMSEVL